MKITDKHRIKFKRKEAPGELVEMAIFRDVAGVYLSASGSIVAYRDGTPCEWVSRLRNGTSRIFEGEIIPPPLEQDVGTVLKHDEETGHIICFTARRDIRSPWVNDIGETYTPAEVELLMAEGWKEVDTD